MHLIFQFHPPLHSIFSQFIPLSCSCSFYSSDHHPTSALYSTLLSFYLSLSTRISMLLFLFIPPPPIPSWLATFPFLHSPIPCLLYYSHPTIFSFLFPSFGSPRPFLPIPPFLLILKLLPLSIILPCIFLLPTLPNFHLFVNHHNTHFYFLNFYLPSLTSPFPLSVSFLHDVPPFSFLHPLPFHFLYLIMLFAAQAFH